MRKPKALDAFATQNVRLEALEAAAAGQCDAHKDTTEDSTTNGRNSLQMEPTRPARNRPNTPFGQCTDGTESAARAFAGVVEGVKSAVHEAIVWSEKKAGELARTEDHAGPYGSPATAAGGISDLDVIATGVLPATVPVQEDEKNKERDSDRQSDRNI